MYKIGELSALCHIPVKTLRYYADIGLLVPDEIDRFTGYRYYSAEQLYACHRIAALKALGFSLDEIRTYRDAGQGDSLLAVIGAKARELEARQAQIALQLRELETMKENITNQKALYPVALREAAPIRVAELRKVYPTAADAETALAALLRSLPRRAVGPRRLLVHHETAYKTADLDLSVCVELTETVPACGDYTVRTLAPAHRLATLVCPRDEAERGLTRLLEYIGDHGYITVGSIYETRHADGPLELAVPVEPATVLTVDAEPLPFENDPAVIGRWELLDILPSAEQFCDGHPKCEGPLENDELYFLPGGEGYWIWGGWTRGILYQRFRGRCLACPYTLRRVGERTLLFVEMHHLRDGHALTTRACWVYAQTTATAYTKADIAIRDNTDLPALPDPSVTGRWVVRDFYPTYSPDAFDPAVQNRPQDSLFLRALDFAGDNTCVMVTEKGESRFPYTRGILLSPRSGTASAYETRELDGKEYLFLEWKSGDYVWGRGRVNMYVLTR